MPPVAVLPLARRFVPPVAISCRVVIMPPVAVVVPSVALLPLAVVVPTIVVPPVAVIVPPVAEQEKLIVDRKSVG